MIPAAFDYHRPQGIEDAVAILQAHGDDARVIAGGHSLIPMMKLRMAEVPNLVDLQDIRNCLSKVLPCRTVGSALVLW